MPDRFGAGEWPDPAALPPHQRALHARIQKAAREQRVKGVKAKDVDDRGRVWPGLVKPTRKPNQ